MTVRLRLLCHAPTSAVRTSAFPADEALDPQGRRQLAKFSKKSLGADRIWTSPALRTRQTAEALQLGATVEPTLRDCDYGRWAGRSLDEVQAQESNAVAEWLRDLEAAPHGGESIHEVTERVALWLDTRIGSSGRIVAVTHASVIRAAIMHALGAPPQSFWRIDVAPLSVTTLHRNDRRWNLSSICSMQAKRT
jgi:broad specificity phosphatase PhoE